MLSEKTKIARQEFIRRHMFLSDEVFCADIREAEPELLKAARKELTFAPDALDRDIFRALSQAYYELTNVRG